jgi:hypothetical protein
MGLLFAKQRFSAAVAVVVGLPDLVTVEREGLLPFWDLYLSECNNSSN